jgi:predicted O-methyltransferase YrrM
MVSKAGWDSAERYLAEDEVLRVARQRAAEMGCTPVSPGTGAALRLLARLVDARSAIELGTGTGVSGTYLMRGMRPDGILTSVDTEPEHQRLARLTFDEAGFASTRFRLISGSALEVLPRFTEGGYDLVFVDAVRAEYPDYLEVALRLLRPGGALAIDDAQWHDNVADPGVTDAETVAVRAAVEAVRDDPRLVSALLPSGTGLLVATRAAGA